MKAQRPWSAVLLAGALLAMGASARAAEVSELRVAKQYGLGYMQMVLMEDRNLIEQQATKAGLGDVKVSWSTFRSSDVMNDALLSGNLDIASLGVPGLAVIWSKTRGLPVEVKGLTGMNLAPLILVTRLPEVRSLEDFRDGHKIALPAIKVSTQAILLQMGAARIWGKDSYARLDPLTVSMTHPDAMTALLSGGGEVTSHFASPPFAQQELATPGLHAVTSSTEILGGDLSFNVLAAPTRFVGANPRLTAAFLAALEEATTSIARDPRAAAETYLRVTKGKQTPEELMAIMKDAVVYTTRPQGTLPVLQFMADIGTIKVRPERWTDYMHAVAHGAEGS